MVHPANMFEHASSPHPDTRIIDKAKLPELRDAFRSLAKALAANDAFRTLATVVELLKAHGLTAELFVALYTVKFRVKK